MNKDTFHHLQTWFQNYVHGYYSEDMDIDFHIRLKEDHTLKVCSNIRAIGQELGLEEERLFLAEAIALLHDIGRFEQYKKYRTFSDGKSENHASLGIRVLESTDILDSIDSDERRILLKAISFHNISAIPDPVEPECLMFSRLIRDADKLDILDILVKYYEEPESYPSLNVGEAKLTSGYSPQIVSDVLNGRAIQYSDVKTSNDMKLLRLSWVFDINFRYTLECIKSRRYLERMINALPDTTDIQKVQKQILEYVDEKLSQYASPGLWVNNKALD